MIKWIIIAILAGLVLALYFHTDTTKSMIDVILKLFN